MIGSTPQGHACLDLLWQPSKAGKIRECWQLWPIVGAVGNGAAEEDWCWDLNPSEAAKRHLFGTTGVWGTTWLGQRRATDFYFFPEIQYPTLAEGEGRTVCVCGYSKGLWDLNEDIKSLLLSLYNSLNK